MSRVIFGRGVTPPAEGLNPLNLLGNGRLATTEAQTKLAQLVNKISGARRRVLAQWSVRPGDLSGVTGTTTWTQIQYFRVRPSYQMTRVRAVIVALPSSSTDAAATPGLRFLHQETSIGTPGLVNTYRSMDIGRRDTGTLVPDDYFILEQTLGPETNTSGTDEIVPGRNYDLYLQGRGGARVLSVTIFEESGSLYVENPNDRGDGDSFTSVSPYTRLTDAAATFNTSLIGAPITITGATSAGNNGTFYIHRIVSSTVIEYGNASGVSEAFAAGTRYRIRSPSVTPGWAGQPILDDDIERLLQIPYSIWKEGGGHLFEWANELGTVPARTSATYANVHDESLTAWNSGGPGHWTWPYKQGSYELARSPVVMWAYASVASGAAGGVRFVVNGRTVGTVSVNTTLQVYTTTGYLESSNATDKVDVLYAGNGSFATSVYAYGMYQHE